MATFYLVRHAEKEGGEGFLPGRTPGVHLTDLGREQAERLAGYVEGLGITRVLSSPMERAQETATPLAKRLGVRVETMEAFSEVDFGRWTGANIDDLGDDEAFKRFNSFRSGTRIPGGSLMTEVQAQFVGALLQLRDQEPDGSFVIVSHGDPIRAALCYALGIPLDFVFRFSVDSASVSILALGDWGPHVYCINRAPGDGLMLED